MLAAYLRAAADEDLGTYLSTRVFADAELDVVAPDPDDVAGFATFLDRYPRASRSSARPRSRSSDSELA